VVLALGTKNLREIGRLVSVVRPSTLTGEREEINHIYSLCFSVVGYFILLVGFPFIKVIFA
jgi:hypothetical protein